VTWSELHVGLPGAFQRGNAELALLALAVARERWPLDEPAVRAGLAAVRWPGRLATVREAPRVVLDGAHNPAAVATLCAELPAVVGGRRVTLVFAAMEDKAWGDELACLLPHCAEVVLTRVGRRAEDPRRLASVVGTRRPVVVDDDPQRAVLGAIERAGPAGAVLVTGSLFLVGAAYAALAERPFETWHGWEGGGTEARR
jgi:dihydrofolate synthase/folylpolyglutamate synthase